MVKGKAFKLFGLLFLVLGVTIVFNTFQGITGFAVYNDVDLDAGMIVGAWFVLTGIVLFVYRRKEVKRSGKGK